ncbi:MAG: hypothetical protein KF791_07185 [Verrucomicrobiae bacterium]|nr:hypothetical protein [Verrucomicrobiae bacterium]
MNSIPITRWLAALLMLAFVAAGCSNDEKDPDADKPFTMPGASKVLDALAKKDYEPMVEALAEVKAGVTEKTKDEYRRLRQKVTDQLVEEMGDNEAAQQAYRAIGMLETGR